MKLKDLPKGTNLGGIKVKIPGSDTEGYWVSQWQKGVWLRYNKEDTQVHPQFITDLTECLEWEVIDERYPDPKV